MRPGLGSTILDRRLSESFGPDQYSKYQLDTLEGFPTHRKRSRTDSLMGRTSAELYSSSLPDSPEEQSSRPDSIFLLGTVSEPTIQLDSSIRIRKEWHCIRLQLDNSSRLGKSSGTTRQYCKAVQADRQ